MNTIFKLKEKQVKDLLKKAAFIKNDYFILRKSNFTELKIVISVRKKLYPKAVVRNRIKRIIREIIINNFGNEKNFYLIIVGKFEKEEINFNFIKKKLLELI
ncbi:MAG: ribonuclease P protein component [Candidatus Muiribacteriota bacterium]